MRSSRTHTKRISRFRTLEQIMDAFIAAIGCGLGIAFALVSPKDSISRAILFGLAAFAGLSAIAGAVYDAQDAIIAQLHSLQPR